MIRETTTPADALWRIAELASRTSDPRWRGDRRQAMADLEAAISEIGSRLAGGQEALEAAGADREDDLRSLRRAHHELSMTRAALARVEAERDQERAERNRARAALASARSDLAAAQAALAAARAAAEEAEAGRLAAQRERRVVEMERDAAISVLSSVPAREIDLRTPESTSEEIAPKSEETAANSEETAAAEVAEDHGSDGTVVELRGSPAGAAPRTRLLHVAATLGHLLPDDLDPLLGPGVQVVRREGRLAALLAVPVAGSPWAVPTTRSDEEQAQALQAAGFRVAWSTGDCLAS